MSDHIFESQAALQSWSVTLSTGARVTLVRDEPGERNMLVFTRDGNETTLVLSDAALAAVVSLAVSRCGVPVMAG